MENNIEQVSKAFSAQAAHFDSDEESNLILRWMREQVYRHEEEFLSPNSRILELNAGTGRDAVYFADRGHSVVALDIAPGMVRELQKKITDRRLEDRIRCIQCSFTQLDTLTHDRYDHVFSNFGGLNCLPNIQDVTLQLPVLLKPGATVTFVMMPRISPWEIAQIVRGRFRFAFRRLSKNGASAQIDGYRFQSYYHSPAEIVKQFGNRFSLVKLRGLASVSPPPSLNLFPIQHPSVYRTLIRFDERFAEVFPFNRWADHFIITMRFQS